MVKKISHNQLKALIKVYYTQKNNQGKKVPLLVWGTFGIGKSFCIKDTAIELAEKRGRKFVEWNLLSAEQKDVVFKKPKEYFVLIDIRMAESDISDIKGLPDFKEDKESVVWKVPFWAKFLEQEDSDGVLFLDELNLASAMVLSNCYKLIYDRIVNEGKISDNWLIIGAGNLETDLAFTQQVPSPVKDRGGEVELCPARLEDWVDWAVKNGIDSRIIAFLNWKPSALHLVDFDSEQKYTTERGWERVNTLIHGIKGYEHLELITPTAIGEGIAREFCAFCKISEKMDLEELIRKPNKLREITDISLKHFVVVALSEWYKMKKVKFTDILAISEVLDDIGNAEFVAVLWKMCARQDIRRFKEDYLGKNSDSAIKQKYVKYLGD